MIRSKRMALRGGLSVICEVPVDTDVSALRDAIVTIFDDAASGGFDPCEWACRALSVSGYPSVVEVDCLWSDDRRVVIQLFGGGRHPAEVVIGCQIEGLYFMDCPHRHDIHRAITVYHYSQIRWSTRYEDASDSACRACSEFPYHEHVPEYFYNVTYQNVCDYWKQRNGGLDGEFARQLEEDP